MAWIESHQSIGRHPKLNKLRALTGWSKHETMGVLHDLWHWVLAYAEDGDISKFTSEEIAIGIDIDPAKFNVSIFINKLIEAGFVRKDMKIHDWMDYAGKYLTSKYRNHNPKKLLEIQKKYGKKIGRTKGAPRAVDRAQMDEAPTLPTVPTLHNQDNITINTLSPKRANLSDEDFIQALKINPAYQGVDIDKELARMDMWLLTPKGRSRKKTHKFILGWMDRADRTLNTGATNGTSKHTGLAKKDYTAGLDDF